ncbi:hypothetical protein [Nitrosomonas sp.]|uniref:hypothetical protein n=1 Tax=Nitrosomonas sp. TaxID=42353 RepID=UPI0025EDA6D5|nr:hypothetical protein [Nitrosomonas sp.]
MHIDNSPDFKTVWRLAHDWIGADPDKTDPSAISPELRTAIHRLMHAMYSREISARWKGWRIFIDDSFISSVFDFFHDLRFIQCLRSNKFNKAYLDSLYVKRNEVINWCINVARLEPPPCWATTKLQSTEAVDTDDENKNWYDGLTERRKRKIGCLELARKLWEENPKQSYDQIRNHPIMKQYGNPSVFTQDTFQNWAKNYASEFAKKGGRRKKSVG